MRKTITTFRSTLLILCVSLALVPNAGVAQEIERLHIYKKVEQHEGGTLTGTDLRSMSEVLEWNGYRTDKGGKSGIKAEVSPRIYRDSNVNGGYPGGTFNWNGFQFEIDPNYRAVASTVLELNASADAFFRWGSGRLFRASVARSFASDGKFNFSKSSFSGCSLNDLGNWFFVDACYTQQASKRKLSESESKQVVVTASKIFPLGDAALNFSIGRKIDLNNLKGEIWKATVTTLLETKHVVSVSMEKGPKALQGDDGTTLSLSYYTTIFDKSVRASLMRSIPATTAFLGVARNEERSILSLSVNLTDRTTFSTEWEVNKSTVDLFDYENIRFEVSFQALRF